MKQILAVFSFGLYLSKFWRSACRISSNVSLSDELFEKFSNTGSSKFQNPNLLRSFLILVCTLLFYLPLSGSYYVSKKGGQNKNQKYRQQSFNVYWNLITVIINETLSSYHYYHYLFYLNIGNWTFSPWLSYHCYCTLNTIILVIWSSYFVTR